jgi:hypothetical protein
MPEREASPAAAPSAPSLAEWCHLACSGPVVRRGLKFAVVVGSILITINHGDAIIAGELTRSNYLKMGLTVVVPYVVSVLSSVGAMAHAAKAPPCVEEQAGV